MLRISSILLISLFLIFNFAFAQAPAKEPKLCVLSGRVVNGGTSEPVRKAKITLRASSSEGVTATSMIGGIDDSEATGEPAVTTDQDGNFSFEKLKPGIYSLAVEKTGYAGIGDGRSHTPQDARRITLSVGQEIRDLLIRMVPSASISGRVLDQDGEPLANVSVSALRYKYSGTRKRRLLPIQNVTTNDLGEYRLFGMAPADYYLSASPIEREEPLPVSTDNGKKVQYRYATTYYPGSLSDADAQALSLRPGEEVRANFNLALASTVKVSGRVVGLSGERDGFRGMVTLMNSSGGRGGNAPMKANSDAFEISGVLPGSYVVMAVGVPQGNDYSKMPMGTARITVGASDVSGVQVTLESMRQQQIKGKITITGGPAQNVEHLGVVLQPVAWREADDENPIAQRTGGYSRDTKKDGTFTMDAIGRGTVLAMVFASGSGVEDYYTKSVHYGGRDVTATGFSLATNAELDIQIGADGTRIEGLVVDENDKPLAESTVVLVPEESLRSQPDLFALERTDQNGHFTMRGVRPGSYTIYAWDDLGDDDGAYYFDDFLKKFADRAQTVKVEANGHAILKVNVISSAPAAQAEK